MGEREGIGPTTGHRRTAVPQAGDASAFGADCLLADSFVIACGLPLFWHLGIPGSPALAAVYIASVAVLVALTPFLIWLLHWGLPVPLRVRRMSLAALVGMTPVLVAGTIAVAAGMQSVFLGISIMSVSAAVLIVLAGERFRDEPAPIRLKTVRLGVALLTPLIVLGLTQYHAPGTDIVSGWAIPVPAAAAGAVGASRGFLREMRTRDRARADR